MESSLYGIFTLVGFVSETSLVRERNYDSFKNFKIYKDLYGKLFNRDWLARVSSHTSLINFRRPLH